MDSCCPRLPALTDDHEPLLEIDPPVLLFRGHENQPRVEFQNMVVQYTNAHDVASDLTA